jgi:thiol-disulfide isomerase/thioredoxin
MKKLLTILLLIGGRAFSQSSGNFNIRGQIDKNSGTVYLIYSRENKSIIDSCKIVNGTFDFAGNIAQPVIAYIKPDRSMELTSNTSYMFLEPSNMTLQLKHQPWSVIKIEGSKTQNELMEWKSKDTKLKSTFAKTLNELETEKDPNRLKSLRDSMVLYHDQKTLVEYDFIKTHPDSYVSPYLLDIHYQNYTIQQLQGIYDNMSNSLRNSVYGKELSKHIDEMASNSKGTMAAPINSNDFVTNKEFDLQSLHGRFVMMDFWGSWCGPCLRLIPAIVDDHKKYSGENIAFVSVCFDYNGNMGKCKDIINKMGMSWVNLWDSEDKVDNNSLTTRYNIGIYPTVILIGRDGKILERGEGEYGYLKCKNLLDTLLKH